MKKSIILFLRRNKNNLLSILSHVINKNEYTIWQAVIERTAKNTKEVFFVEIGAWDGVECDPLHEFIIKYKLNGICIEPQKMGFQKLQETYNKHKNITLVNAAMQEKDGVGILFTIMNRNGKMVTGHSSLSKEKVLLEIRTAKKNQGAPEQFFVEEPTPCLCLESLLKKYNVKKIDILQIDAEGADYNIIKTIPFHLIKPKVIRFERGLLSKTEEKEAAELLKKQRYCLIKAGIDYIAVGDLQGIKVLFIVLEICRSVHNTIAYCSHLLALKWKLNHSLNPTES